MGRLAFVLVAFAVVALHAGAQTGDQLYTATRQQLDVTKALLAQQAAWNKGDLTAYLAFYKDTPETQATLGLPVRGIGNIRANYKAAFPTPATMGTLEESNVEVRPLGEAFALATGKYELQRDRKHGGKTEGAFTDILEKTPDGWKLIFSETP
jgi:uncharacterized protein (TIGR02246 family)